MSGPTVGTVIVASPILLAQAVKESYEQRKLKKAKTRLNDAIKRARNFQAKVDELKNRFNALELPTMEISAPSHPNEAEAIEQAADRVLVALRNYSKQVETHLMRFHQNHATDQAGVEMEQWSSQFSFSKPADRGEILQLLDSLPAFSTKTKQEAILKQIRENARKKVAELPNLPGYIISVETMASLEQVVSSTTQHEAQLAYQKLEQSLNTEALAIKKQIDEEKANRLRSESDEETRQKIDILEQISITLSELGYNTTGIESTAFVEDGELYAVHSNWPNHAIRIEQGKEANKIRTVPVRLVENDIEAQSLKPTHHQEDSEFDRFWCAHGVIDLKKSIKKYGVNVRFTADAKPGEGAVETVNTDSLDESTRSILKKRSIKRQQTRSRIQRR